MSILKKKFLIFIFFPFLLILCGLSFSAARLVCDIKVPTISIDQSIHTFVSGNTYDADTLVLAAKRLVESRIGRLQQEKISFVSANYLCRDHICNLERLNIEITGVSSIDCPLPNEYPLGHDAKTFFFLFDAVNDLVAVDTVSGTNIRENQPRWQDISIRIEDTVRIAYQTKGEDFALQYPQYRLRVTLGVNSWEVGFNSDLTEQNPAQAKILVDFNNGSVTD